MKELLAQTKIEDGKCLAQCQECGAWREVAPEPKRADSYFEFWEAEFSCCHLTQKAVFTMEKTVDDVH
jgi:hypothetical protein